MKMILNGRQIQKDIFCKAKLLLLPRLFWNPQPNKLVNVDEVWCLFMNENAGWVQNQHHITGAGLIPQFLKNIWVIDRI